MAKLYNRKTKEIYWSDDDIICPIEDAYFELTDFIAMKKLDGHDVFDQWYMRVQAKMGELLDLMNNSPIDELDTDMCELWT